MGWGKATIESVVVDDEITNKELKIWLGGKFKAAKEKIRESGRSPERADKWFGRSAGIDSVEHGYFHCAADDSLVDLFRQASMG